jgi:outer membrane protein, heavy metal efflux system
MIALLFTLCCAATEIQPPFFHAANDELRGYLLEAAEKRPDLQARYSEWKAALQKVPQVTSLDDPIFSYTQFLRSEDKTFELSMEQKFTWFGTLRARGNKALADADAALARFYAARNVVFDEVKRAYFEYAFLGKSIEITQSQIDVLKEVEDLVRSRYGLGMGAESDVYRAEIARDRLQDQRSGLEQSRPALSARLGETLGRENADILPLPQAAELPSAPPAESNVMERVRSGNPELNALQQVVESWRKQEQVAKKAWYPDFWLMFAYGDVRNQDQLRGRMRQAFIADSVKTYLENAPVNGALPTLGNIAYDSAKERFLLESESMKDDYSVTFRMSLPIWYPRIKAGVREAQIMQEAASQDKQRAAIALDAQAKMMLYRIQDARRRHTLYRDNLTPKEKQAYQSLRSQYDAGAGADFLDLMNSLSTLLEFQLEEARACQDLHIATADLEMIMGGPWTE